MDYIIYQIYVHLFIENSEYSPRVAEVYAQHPLSFFTNAFNSRAGAVTLADLLALRDFETKNVQRIVPMLNPISNHLQSNIHPPTLPHVSNKSWLRSFSISESG